ncbi:MAG: type II secretion system F family protein [Gaiellales bacterium]
MRRVLTFVMAAATLLVAAPGAAHAAKGVGVTLDPNGRFPERRLLVTLPPGVPAYDVRVTENGVPVIPHLRSVSNGSIPLSLAVLVDTSDSMRGARLTAARDAAETLIAASPARAQTAMFGFAGHPYLMRGWSSQISPQAALLGIRTSNGTAIWDAVTTASQLLSERHGSSHAIVLLTDGRDTASDATEADAAAAARAAGARVFAVVLPGQIDSALRNLVDATGGEFVQVHSIDNLHHVYATLAQRLRQQYVLSYTSQLRHAGTTADVRVMITGRSAELHYTVPALAAPPAPKAHGWWTGNQALAALIALVGLLVLAGTYMIARPKPVSASRRLRGYIGAAAPESDPLAAMPARPRRLDSRPASNRVWAKFEADVQRAGLPFDARRVLWMAIAGGLLVGAAATLISGAPYGLIAAPLLAVSGTWLFVTHRASGWYARFDAALPESLNVLSSSLRAGHSLLQAISYVAEEADDTTRPEWEEVVRQTRLGVAVEDAIDDMTVRIGNADLAWVAMITRVQHQVGGNMAEMFDIVAETIRERHRLRAQLHALTAQGRMTRWVLTIAPFALGLIMMTFSPIYITGFLNDPAGRLMLAVGVGLVLLGSLWLKRVVEVEV